MKYTFSFLICFAFVSGVREIGYHVALLVDGVKFCSGSLIEEYFVVTTASCVTGAYEVDVVLGIDNNLLHPTDTAFILTSFIINEDFVENESRSRNIALINLTNIRNFDGTKYNVKTLRIPGEFPEQHQLKLMSFDLEKSGNLSVQDVTLENDSNEEQDLCLATVKSDSDINYGTGITDDMFLWGITVNNTKESTIEILKMSPPITDWINSKIYFRNN